MSDWRYRATVHIHICRLNIEFIEDLSECERFEKYVPPSGTGNTLIVFRLSFTAASRWKPANTSSINTYPSIFEQDWDKSHKGLWLNVESSFNTFKAKIALRSNASSFSTNPKSFNFFPNDVFANFDKVASALDAHFSSFGLFTGHKGELSEKFHHGMKPPYGPDYLTAFSAHPFDDFIVQLSAQSPWILAYFYELISGKSLKISYVGIPRKLLFSVL